MSPNAEQRPMRATQRLRSALLFVAPLLGTAALFLPVTGAYFHRDDFLHLVAVTNHPLHEIVWRPFMGHLYVVPRLNYAWLLATVGPTPAPFFWFALVLHLINTALLFSLTRKLTDSARLASVVALLWGTSALHTFTLSYFCLHAHVLVGLALLLALRGLANAEALARPSWSQAAGWTAVVFAASLSYGTGLVLALTFPVIALLCLWGRLPAKVAIPLWLLPLAVVVLYATVRATSPSTTYGSHRLSTGLRASLANPWEVLEMFGHAALFALSTLGAIVPGLSRSYPSTGAIVVGGLMALLLMVGCVRRSERRNWVVALVLFAASCYAVTAITPAYERQIFRQPAQTKAQDHRYHYAPTLALALALALTVGDRTRRSTAPPWLGDAATGLVYVLVAWTALTAPRVVDLHPQNRVEVEQVLEQARRAATAVPAGDMARILEAPFRGGFGFWPSKLSNAAVFTLFHPSGEMLGRPVRYDALAGRPSLDAAPDSPLARVMINPPERPDRDARAAGDDPGP